MRIFWAAAAAAAVMSCAAAQAEERHHIPASGEPGVGVGIICNTLEQAGQFVRLRGKGAAPTEAMNAVNTAARDPRACGVAAVAFIRDGTIDTRTMKDTLVQIVRINVVAGFNGTGWQRVTGVVQYAVLEGEGETI